MIIRFGFSRLCLNSDLDSNSGVISNVLMAS